MIGRKDWELQQAILKHNCCDGEASSSDSGTGEIDYEDIYQFYKKRITESVPEQLIQVSIIPEHFIDIKEGTGDSVEYDGKYGIWKGDPEGKGVYLFTDFSTVPDMLAIYFGVYVFTGGVSV